MTNQTHASPPTARTARAAGRAAAAAALAAALFGGSTAAQAPAGGPGAAASQAAAPAAAVRAVLRADAPRQTIYGFGGSITYGADSTADFVGREAAYEAIFSELRIDILRLRNWHGYAAPGAQDRFEAVTREYAGAAKRWSDPARRGPEKGPVRVLFTSWSPPERLKSNNRVQGREDGTDKGKENVTLRRLPGGKYDYDGYADWWREGLEKYRQLSGGALPDYIALQNEQDFLPSYEGMKFLPTEGIGKGGYHFAGYDRALAAVHGRLGGAFGASAPKIIGPETFTIQVRDGVLNLRPYADPATPEGRATLDRLWGVSFHLYGSGAGPKDNDPTQARFRAALAEAAKTYHDPKAGVNKPLFQTEYIEGDTLTKLGVIMHESLTTGENAAYLVWLLTRRYDPSSSMLVSFSMDGSRDIRKHDRFWAMKHYSYFVGENWKRVEAEASDPAVKLSAYRSPSGASLVAVAVNPTDQARSVVFAPDGAGFAGRGTAEAYRSTEGDSGEHWRALGPVAAGSAVEMPPKSMLTLRFTQASPTPGRQTGRPSAAVPSPRGDENSRIAHQQLVAKAKSGGIDLYFLGDSITRRWGTSDPAYAKMLANWKQNFFGWNAGNFGWGADGVQHMLWRVRNGEMEGVNPKVVVILAGTNNIGNRPADSAEAADAKVADVVRGIEALVAACREKAPGAKIILTAIFPRNDNKAVLPEIRRVNEGIARLADGKTVFLLNVNDRLADAGGNLFDGMTEDGLHLSVRGYQVWADGLRPLLTKFLGPPAKTDHAPPPTGDPSAARPAAAATGKP